MKFSKPLVPKTSFEIDKSIREKDAPTIRRGDNSCTIFIFCCRFKGFLRWFIHAMTQRLGLFFFLFPSLFSSLIIIGRKISESFEGEK